MVLIVGKTLAKIKAHIQKLDTLLYLPGPKCFMQCYTSYTDLILLQNGPNNFETDGVTDCQNMFLCSQILNGVWGCGWRSPRATGNIHLKWLKLVKCIVIVKHILTRSQCILAC